mgnify:FL=1
MVRLKANPHAKPIFSIIIFQFLMVRLKEKKRCIFDENNKISIPYGSIKRKQRSEGQLLQYISIPYGSIKR